MQNGIYDFLKDYGIQPNLEESLKEKGRNLSGADITTTLGRCDVLISDTARLGEDFSHINA